MGLDISTFIVEHENNHDDDASLKPIKASATGLTATFPEPHRANLGCGYPRSRLFPTPEMQLRRADTTLGDDQELAHVTYNDKYVVVYDFSNVGKCITSCAPTSPLTALQTMRPL